jgi:hypothetical protein
MNSAPLRLRPQDLVSFVGTLAVLGTLGALVPATRGLRAILEPKPGERILELGPGVGMHTTLRTTWR